ncbi:MAG TPA: hypothetical protein VF753_17290 [Terriglobales bacterium]
MAREKKLLLVSGSNPEWRDLAADWYETQGPSAAVIARAASDRPRSG